MPLNLVRILCPTVKLGLRVDQSVGAGHVRIDAGNLFATGCLLAAVGGYRHRFVNPQRGCTQTKFSSNSRTSPAAAPGEFDTRDKLGRVYPAPLYDALDRVA